MGTVAQYYCDGCGSDIGQGLLSDAIQINAVGTNGRVSQIMLCLQSEPPEDRPLPGEEAYDPNADPYKHGPGKIRGCARKVLTKTMLARLYEDVAAVTGDPEIKPFPL